MENGLCGCAGAIESLSGKFSGDLPARMNTNREGARTAQKFGSTLVRLSVGDASAKTRLAF